MTTFNTGNPIGSTAVKDLYDNAENLDYATNDRSSRSWPDRFGAPRRTWWGMEQDFQDFLMQSGFVDIGEYGPGIEITARNQVFRRDGQYWRAGPTLDLPYTTTGDWGTEGGFFVISSDDTLRDELADGSDAAYGAALVAFLQRGTDAEPRTVLDKLRESVSVKDFGAIGDGVTDDTDAIANAIASFSSGGKLFFPAGTYLVSAGGLTEGTSFILDADASNIRFVGEGKELTFIKPLSNEIEIFAQDGAENISFEEMTFDNSANGVLQNEEKSEGTVPNGGVAAWGNAANCAIRQYSGAGTALRNVRFIEFTACLDYYGDITDNQVLSGAVVSDGVESIGCIFVHLLHQEEILTMTNGICINNRDSINEDTSIDPGHFLYQTDRAGAKPKMVTISDIKSSGGYSSSIKLRKAQVASISNVAINGDGRGIEISNINGACTVSNVSVKLADTTIDSGRNGFFVDDCANLRANNIVVDIRGTDAWGVRVRKDVGEANWQNRDCIYDGITVIADFSVATGKAPFIMFDQFFSEIRNFKFVNTGSVANTRHPIDLRGCTGVKVIDPMHITSLSNADVRNLVQLDASCTDCVVAYHPAEALRASPNATTVSNLGTNTTIIQGRTIADGSFNAELTSGGSAVITFNFPFRFACTSVVAMIQSTSITGAESVYLSAAPTTSGATLNVKPNPGAVARNIRYIATGY